MPSFGPYLISLTDLFSRSSVRSRARAFRAGRTQIESRHEGSIARAELTQVVLCRSRVIRRLEQ